MADGTWAITEDEWREQGASAWPLDEAGWDARHEMLWDAYVGRPYSVGLVKLWHLFRAVADTGEEQDVTQRVHRDFQFIVNAYVPAVAGISAGAGPVLEVAREGDTTSTRRTVLPAGEAIWRRSAVVQSVERWAKTCAVFGSGGWEIVGTQRGRPYAPQVVWRDARSTRVIYDDTCTRIERVIYEAGTVSQDAATKVDARLDQPAISAYRRVLTPTRVEVYRDGRPAPAESYEHRLGRVPFVHVVWEPWTEPEHGLPAGHPIDLALAMCDSIHCQIRAIGTRMGNPVGVLAGARLGADGATHALHRLGNVLSVPADASFAYAEVKSSITQLLEAVKEVRAHIRETEPAYLFADSSASESGEAKGYRAALFESRVAAIRSRFHGGLAEATGIALAYSADRPYDDEALLKVDLPPILPRNVPSEVKTYVEIRGDLRPADRVRQLQRMGYVPADADPDEYARQAQDEGGAAAVDMMGEDAAAAATRGQGMVDAADGLGAAADTLEKMAATLLPGDAAAVAAALKAMHKARAALDPGSHDDPGAA